MIVLQVDAEAELMDRLGLPNLLVRPNLLGLPNLLVRLGPVAIPPDLALRIHRRLRVRPNLLVRHRHVHDLHSRRRLAVPQELADKRHHLLLNIL